MYAYRRSSVFLMLAAQFSLCAFFGGETPSREQVLTKTLETLTIKNVGAFRLYHAKENADKIVLKSSNEELLSGLKIKGDNKVMITCQHGKDKKSVEVIDIYADLSYVKHLGLTNSSGAIPGKVTILNDDEDEAQNEPFDDVTIRLSSGVLDVGGLQAEKVELYAKKDSRFHIQKVEGKIEVSLNRSYAKFDMIASKKLKARLAARSKLHISGKAGTLELDKLTGSSLVDGIQLNVSNMANMKVSKGGMVKIGQLKDVSGRVSGGSTVLWRTLSGKSTLNVDKGSFAGDIATAKEDGFWKDLPVEDFLRN